MRKFLVALFAAATLAGAATAQYQPVSSTGGFDDLPAANVGQRLATVEADVAQLKRDVAAIKASMPAARVVSTYQPPTGTVTNPAPAPVTFTPPVSYSYAPPVQYSYPAPQVSYAAQVQAPPAFYGGNYLADDGSGGGSCANGQCGGGTQSFGRGVFLGRFRR